MVTRVAVIYLINFSLSQKTWLAMLVINYAVKGLLNHVLWLTKHLRPLGVDQVGVGLVADR